MGLKESTLRILLNNETAGRSTNWNGLLITLKYFPTLPCFIEMLNFVLPIPRTQFLTLALIFAEV